jgi:predicted MFS family arabinose efflux permease
MNESTREATEEVTESADHPDLITPVGDGGPRGRRRSLSARAALREPSFRALWLGQSVSAIGTRTALVALVLFIALDGGGAGGVGVVLAAYAIPLLALMLWGGVWADRLPRHRVLLGADLARAGLHAAAAVLVFSGEASLAWLAAIGAAFGAADAFARPACAGLVPQTVPRNLIQPANALLALSDNIADFAGPALAAVLVTTAGAGWAFAIDAVTFAFSAALLLRMRPRRESSAPAQPPPLRALLDGFAHVRSRAWVWRPLLAISVVLMVGFAPWLVIGPVVAADQYGSAAVFALLLAAQGAGAMVGSLLGLHLRPLRPITGVLLATAAWPVLVCAFAAGAPIAALVAGALGAGAGISLANVWWTTALAERIPSHALSRVAAWDWIGSLALVPVGYLVAAPVAHALGATTMLAAGGLVSIAVLAWAALPGHRRVYSTEWLSIGRRWTGPSPPSPTPHGGSSSVR